VSWFHKYRGIGDEGTRVSDGTMMQLYAAMLRAERADMALTTLYKV